MVVTLRPKYPRWFEPAARLVEERPQLAIFNIIVATALVFSAGTLLGFLLRALMR
jgi:hypothetical protein